MATTRKRRTLKPRNSRTYYAMTKDESTLIRFANHAQRLDSIRKEGLVPLGALEYREKIATDNDGKLKMIDRRGELKAFEAAQAAAAVAQPPTTQAAPLSAKQTETVLESAPQPQGGDTVTELGAAIAAALKPFLERGHIQITPQGVQPVQPVQVAQPGKQH